MKTLLASATTDSIRHIQGAVNNYFYSKNYIIDPETLLLINPSLPAEVIARKNEQFKIVLHKGRYKFYSI